MGVGVVGGGGESPPGPGRGDNSDNGEWRLPAAGREILFPGKIFLEKALSGQKYI